MNLAMRVADKVAIVTGAGRGIGRAIALDLAREGANLVVAARTRSEVEQAAREIRQMGRRSLALTTDVTAQESVAAMAEATLRDFGRIDILVNNAGVNQPLRPVIELEPELWDRIIAVNLKGTYLCARAVLPAMLEQGSGRIINISSIGGRRGRAQRSAYRAAKAGVLSLTESLSDEVKQAGINVNAICPAGVATEMLRQTMPGRDPLTLMTPEEIAAVVVFLASDEARAVHGAVLDVFGSASGIQAGA